MGHLTPSAVAKKRPAPPFEQIEERLRAEYPSRYAYEADNAPVDQRILVMQAGEDFVEVRVKEKPTAAIIVWWLDDGSGPHFSFAPGVGEMPLQEIIELVVELTKHRPKEN